MARMTSKFSNAAWLGFFVLMIGTIAHAQEVGTGLINSNQTYVTNDEGESIREVGIGDIVYVILNGKEDKKHKDFYRVTFDPTNLAGDGWVYKDHIKLTTSYHSIDGREPKEYADKPQPIAPSTSTDMQPRAEAPSSESTFLEELVKRDQEKPELRPVTKAPKEEVKKNERNPLQNDLEFLFQEDGEFKKTFSETKNNLKESFKKKIAISKFAEGQDAFAVQTLDIFSKRLKKGSNVTVVSQVGFAGDLEDASGVSVPDGVDGAFFGQISPKIGQARLLKIKYYDKSLKQFTFEKVAKIPLVNSNKTIEAVADECNQFVSK